MAHDKSTILSCVEKIMTSRNVGGGRGSSMRGFLSKASANMNDLKLKASNHSSRLSSSIGGRSTTNKNMSSDDDALRLPMPEITRPFPVVEQPPRCILSSISDNNIRLTSSKKGLVALTSNRGDKEQFLLIPAVKNCGEGDANKKNDVYYLKSYKFHRYLTSDSETGEVSTVKISTELNNNDDDGQEEEEEKKKDWVAAAKAKAESALADNTPTKAQLGDAEQWLLMRSPHGGHFLVSAKNELNVASCSRMTNDGEGRRVSTKTIGLKGENSVEESWDVEFVSGELCFMSSFRAKSSSNETAKQIRCDLMGKLSLTSDKRGWEVWRFVEMGGGKVRIVSWMHSQFCIACNHEGKVSTVGIGKAEEGCDEWTVEKAPEGYEGVVVKSVACARRMLCRSDNDGGGLSTMQEFEGDCSVWQLDAAHSQVYTLASLYHNRSIGPFPYVTNNLKQSDQLVLQMIDDEGTVRLYHKGNGMYLSSNEESEVECRALSENNDTELSTELWKMEQSIDGGYTFTSKAHGGVLSYGNDEVNPKLCTATAMADDKREVWSINPLLPRAISSGKIKTFAIGTSVAVGTTVAMPFLMAGMLAVVPAEATLAASVMAAGLTGAEAIASVGAIGVTAAIVFREDNDTIGIESEHEENDEGKVYTKRPLCAWRSW